MNFPFIRYKNVGGTLVCFVTIYACDGQTDTFAIGKTVLHTMQRGKNNNNNLRQHTAVICRVRTEVPFVEVDRSSVKGHTLLYVGRQKMQL